MGLGGVRAAFPGDGAGQAPLALVAEAHAPLLGLLDDLHKRRAVGNGLWRGRRKERTLGSPSGVSKRHSCLTQPVSQCNQKVFIPRLCCRGSLLEPQNMYRVLFLQRLGGGGSGFPTEAANGGTKPLFCWRKFPGSSAPAPPGVMCEKKVQGKLPKPEIPEVLPASAQQYWGCRSRAGFGGSNSRSHPALGCPLPVAGKPTACTSCIPKG